MRLYQIAAGRLLQLVLTLFFLITVTFLASHVVTGNPARVLAGPYASQDVVDSITRQYGFDKPLYVQYYIYIAKLLHGDLGVSVTSGRNVLSDIGQFFPATAELAITAMVIGVFFGTLLGVIAATHRNRIAGIASSIISLIGYSFPVFWIGLIFQIVFGFYFHLLPVAGRLDATISIRSITGINVIDSVLAGNWAGFQSAVAHLLMPAIVLSFAELGIIAKFVRSTMLDVLDQEYIRTAKAYGFSQTVVNYKYALKNTLIPVLTHIGLDFGVIFGYTVVVELIFQYPGLGLYMSNAILSVDYNAITGCAIILATIVIMTNFVVDILYSVVDPRIRLGARDAVKQ